MSDENKNYDYDIKQLEKPVVLSVKEQNGLMNSDNFNSSLESIEQGLNALYEKTRYLEDAIEYAQTFLNKKIDDYKLRMNNSILAIEDIKKINRNMGYLDYIVPFKENKDSIPDRDKNYKVRPCTITGKDNLLTLSHMNKKTIEPSSYVCKHLQTPYDSTLNDLKVNKKYLSIYIEDKPIEYGVTEEHLIYLPYVQEVNSLNIKPVNCNLNSLVLVYPNGIEETLNSTLTGINTDSRMITHFKFSLTCTNYDIVEYELDEELAKSDSVWGELKELEYGLMVDANSKIEVEALIKRTILHTGTGESETKTYKAATDSTVTATKYLYVMGVDNIEVNLIDLESDSYFLSDNIDIGKLEENEYIQIEVDDNYGKSSGIEYYIVDGDTDISIIPLNQKNIYNERIFPEGNWRFPIDDGLYSEGVIDVKKDGMLIDTDVSNIMNQYDARYSFSYQPDTSSYKYSPINESVKVKAIIRTFGKALDTIPYIKNISVKKYGGNTLWTDVY